MMFLLTMVGVAILSAVGGAVIGLITDLVIYG
jgi:hypothetical protein